MFSAVPEGTKYHPVTSDSGITELECDVSHHLSRAEQAQIVQELTCVIIVPFPVLMTDWYGTQGCCSF